MTPLLAAGCLVLGLITSGDAILCTQCSSSNPSYCVAQTVQCQSKLVCMTLYEVTRMGFQETVNFARGCGEKKMCDKFETVTIKGGKYRLSTTCCNTDYCSPYPPVLPPDSSYSNGRSCPYCLSSTSKDCQAYEKVNCTGNENKCLLENREITNGAYTLKNSIRACATKGYCEMGTRKMESGSQKIKVEVKCTNNANAGLYTTLVPLLLCAGVLIPGFL